MSDDAPPFRRLPEQRCPACGYPVDAVGQCGSPLTRALRPGDEVVCIACAMILVVGVMGEWRVEPEALRSPQALQVQAHLRDVHQRRPHGGHQR